MKSKIKSWIKRYLPAEIAGTLSAIISTAIVFLFSQNILIIALVGTWGENVGFYGTMILRDVLNIRKEYKKIHKKYGYATFAKSIRNIFLEFGVAETADSLIVRPAAMYFTLSVCNNVQLGIIAGKIIADIVFYIPTIISFELTKKYIKK